MRHSPPSSTQPTGCALPVNKGIQHPPPFPLTHAKCCCQIDLIKGISSPGCNCCDAMARTSRMQCLLLLNYDRNSESGSGGALNHPSIYGAIIRRTGYGRIVFVKPRGSRSAPGLSLSSQVATTCIWVRFSLFSFALYTSTPFCTGPE